MQGGFYLKYCPHCHSEIQIGWKFCGHCKAQLCTFCGAEVKPGWNFCGTCQRPVNQNAQTSKTGGSAATTSSPPPQKYCACGAAISANQNKCLKCKAKARMTELDWTGFKRPSIDLRSGSIYAMAAGICLFLTGIAATIMLNIYVSEGTGGIGGDIFADLAIAAIKSGAFYKSNLSPFQEFAFNVIANHQPITIAGGVIAVVSAILLNSTGFSLKPANLLHSDETRLARRICGCFLIALVLFMLIGSSSISGM